MTDREVPLSSWDRESDIVFTQIEEDVRGILLQHNIRLRQDDGELVQINVSRPLSSELALVLGLRYQKRDETYTEDHFVFTQEADGVVVTPHYGRRLERVLPEYQGTHKAQADFLPHQQVPSTPSQFVTDPRTITFNKFIKGR
jgi:hypothetical protein